MKNTSLMNAQEVAEALGVTVFWNGDLSMAMLSK